MNFSNQLSPKKRAFLAGTLLLTGTGFLCRILGFFYRIFLSRAIGAEGLGIFNMLHPIFGVCFAICAGSIQTALSQYIASHTRRGRHVFQTGSAISICLSVLLATLISRKADWLAANVLMEPRCAQYLPLIAYSVPFAAIHACINGYYYGMQKARVPAFSQVAEQMVRMGAVYIIAHIWTEMGNEISVHLAVIGHFIGEAAAALFSFCCLCLIPPQSADRANGAPSTTPPQSANRANGALSAPSPQSANQANGTLSASSPQPANRANGALSASLPQSADRANRTNRALRGTPLQPAYRANGTLRATPPQPSDRADRNPNAALHRTFSKVKAYGRSFGLPLMSLALPLMCNRLVINILASAEAIWIPNRLQMSGLTNSEAFSVYGMLTGMALPFILFPSAITNSIAVLLLPSVAKDQADGKKDSIASSISMALRYSLYMGILCIGIFLLFGRHLGISVFNNAQAGDYIQVLAWLCPFLYLATTMGSILNGLGKTKTTFIQNVSTLLLRIAFVLFAIPRFGIVAYLWGMLASEIVLAAMNLISLRRLIAFPWNAWDMIAKPTGLLAISIGIYYFLQGIVPLPPAMPAFVQTLIWILCVCCCYGGLLLLFHVNGAARRGNR